MFNTFFQGLFLTYNSQCYVIISSIDWSENWQVHQQLASSLVKSGHRVLFIENTGVRAPRVGDIERIRERIRNWLKSTRGFFEVKENLTVFSPIFLPFPYSRFVLLVNRYLLSNTIANWMKIQRFHDPVLITFLPTPLAQAVIDDIDPTLIIYYCADDMAGGSTGAAQLRRYEDAFLSKADAVFCTSHALAERAVQFTKQVYLFPAGVDFTKFKDALENNNVPADLAALSRPVVGYVGSIGAVFDQDLLVHAARELPEVSFVLVGPESADVSLLKTCSNIQLLGKRPHDQVPSYIKGFDVALIPYVKKAFTDAVYPCKLNEYLAMGVPVITSDMREVRLYAERHGNVLEIAKDKEEFVRKIRLALAAPSEITQTQRIAAAQQNSWTQRFKDICEVIQGLGEFKEAQVSRWQDRLTALYRKGRIRVIKPAIVLAVVYIVLFNTPALWFAGNFLVMRASPTPADAIVVFSGDGEPGYVNMSYQKRAMDAVSFYRAGYSSRILVSSGKGNAISESEVVRALLLEHDVPSGAIFIVEKTPQSTWENVQLSVAKLKGDGARKVLFVTAPYHSLRAHLVWKKLAPELKVATVSVVDTPSEQPRWQTSHKIAKVIAYEYLAISYYWWKGWI